jgi:hypothetical protein
MEVQTRKPHPSLPYDKRRINKGLAYQLFRPAVLFSVAQVSAWMWAFRVVFRLSTVNWLVKKRIRHGISRKMIWSGSSMGQAGTFCQAKFAIGRSSAFNQMFYRRLHQYKKPKSHRGILAPIPCSMPSTAR